MRVRYFCVETKEIIGEIQRRDSRAALHMHGAHFRTTPSHGLQRGVVVTQLHTAAHEVLPLENGHATALVRLRGERDRD